ncbi:MULTISPECIES: LysR family transcriptional regulator [Brucella/Ochrobactrum group]|uniref:LysR family transcriptional regulator n=1 Tax=Brucella/Ochrobactrum group TaxID=2826938 RepID=UPI000D708911|nr:MULTISPECIES: LysR family transcriptional regulator [Brucella/Ochrobactrum group]MCH4539045.1 LysR family transcriptional regulator [Ochrobactrum sp. A-1]PWU73478.1 LysR family transcriptional regulator [Ochrobactrum sp. POC9]
MTSISRRLLPSTSALAAFDAVARHESFSAAAEELSLTQGAVSRQIAALEEQLGTALFDRSSRHVVLSDAGRAYLKSVGPALASIRAASLQVMSQMRGTTLNLAFLPTFGTRWLIPRIPRFVTKYPDIILNFATRIGQFDFDREGLDAAIHIGKPDWPNADSVFLMDETVAPVCSPAFLQRNPVQAPTDLLPLPLFNMASRPGAWDHWFKSLDIAAPVSPGMRFEQFSNVSQACIAGLGVALMPLFLIRAEIESGQLVVACPHTVKSPSSYYFVTPKARSSTPAVSAFRDWLLTEIKGESNRSGDGLAD